MAADVRIKRIYDQASPEDGARVLVDRVWPRGVTKEAAALTVWLKEIAPSTALRKWFGHEPARFAEFRRRYLDEIRANAPAVGAPSVLPRGWPHDAALRRARSGAQQRRRACGLSARSGREAACPSFGVSRATVSRRHRSLRGANAAAARVRRCA